jgi:hypothetical protein
MPRSERIAIAGGIAMALVGLCAAAFLVKLALESAPTIGPGLEGLDFEDFEVMP